MTRGAGGRPLGSRAGTGRRVILAATGNAHKLAELQRLLASARVVGFGDLPSLGHDPSTWDVPPDRLEESGATFVENAILKAVHASARCPLPVLADDSGLCVDALDGAPGVRSARHGGPGLDDEGRFRLLLRQMETIPDFRRQASYRAAVALARHGRILSVHEGACAGTILREPRGSGGFGYDPVFLVESAGRTMAELLPAEKDALSHRARATAGLELALADGILDS